MATVETEAWWALATSLRLWKERGAPSWGAMAKSLIRNKTLPQKEIQAIEDEIDKYLTREQLAERIVTEKRRPTLSERFR